MVPADVYPDNNFAKKNGSIRVWLCICDVYYLSQVFLKVLLMVTGSPLLWARVMTFLLLNVNGASFMKNMDGNLCNLTNLGAMRIERQAQPRKHKHVIMILVITLLGGLIVLGCLAGLYISKKNKGRRVLREIKAKGDSGKDDLDLPLFDLVTISTATNDFSEENKLGEGGFGPVYKINQDEIC